MNPYNANIRTLENLLKKNEIKEAIRVLLFFFKEHESRRILISQSAHFKRIEKAFALGLIDWSQLNQSQTQIVNALYDIVYNLKPKGGFHALKEADTIELEDKMKRLYNVLPIKSSKKDNIEYALIAGGLTVAYSAIKAGFHTPGKFKFIGKWLCIETHYLNTFDADSKNIQNFQSFNQFVGLIKKNHHDDKTYLLFQFNLLGKSNLIIETQRNDLDVDRLVIPFNFSYRDDKLKVNITWSTYKISDLVFNVKIKKSEEVIAMLEFNEKFLTLMKL